MHFNQAMLRKVKSSGQKTAYTFAFRKSQALTVQIMKEPIRSISQKWIAFKVGAISKSSFFEYLDVYIASNSEPPFEFIELSALENMDARTISTYFEKNIVDLKWGCETVEVFGIIKDMNSLSIEHISKALVEYLYNDEWGVLETPSDKVNELYGVWVGGQVEFEDKQYYSQLRLALSDNS